MKRPGNRIISIVLAVIMLFSLSANIPAESGTLFASRAFAAEETETGAAQDAPQQEVRSAAAAEEMLEGGQEESAPAEEGPGEGAPE